jgi:hypothetical protein
MITVEHTEDMMTGDQTFVVKLPRKDLVDIKLDKFDQAVINSPVETAADILQSLQILAFRQSQQVEQPNPLEEDTPNE